MIGLAPGEKVSSVDPGRPNAAFDPFVMAILRQIGVALEIPFELLVKHFTASYSAARAALLEAWKFFYTQRKWLADNFCQPVYEAWLTEAVLSGRVSAPGFFDDPLVDKEIKSSRKRFNLRLHRTKEAMRLIDIITSPWAIQPEKLVKIRGIYETHLRGEKIDIKAVEARIGKPLINQPQGYGVVEGIAVIPIDGVLSKRMNLFSQISGGTSSDILSRNFSD